MPPRFPIKSCLPSRLTVSILLLTTTTFNLLFIGWHLLQSRSQRDTYTYQAHDVPETLPLPIRELGSVALTVEESVRYPLLGYASDAQWFGLSSASWGYVRLGPDNRLFVVTMFHELHCLRLLNLAFDESDVAGDHHIKHCLNYLRQMALCSADVTLEPGDFALRDFKVERTGATHTCRDWNLVYSVLDENWDRWSNQSSKSEFHDSWTSPTVPTHQKI